MKITGNHPTTPKSHGAPECPPQYLHPDMNLDEGHLGGYIRSRHSCVPTVEGFEHGDPATWFPELWKWTREALGVTSVLDVGCAEGHAARFFRDLGCRVQGVDGSVQALRDSLIPEQHVRHDFNLGTYIPGDDFDLVWSCEFVEHVEERFCDNFLRTFDAARAYLMVTYAVPGQWGHHHVNLQEEPYWIEKIQAWGFRFDAERTRQTRDLAREGHYASRGLFFERR